MFEQYRHGIFIFCLTLCFLGIFDVIWVHCVPLSVYLTIMLDISRQKNPTTEHIQKLKPRGTFCWNLIMKMGAKLKGLRRKLESSSICIFLC